MDQPYKNAPAKYSSKVWKYFGFSKKDDSKVICKMCLTELNYSGGTTNLKVHLKRHHGIDISSKEPIVVNEDNKNPSQATHSLVASASAQSSPAPPTANPFKLAGRKKLPKAKVNQITISIARYIINDMRPISTTESKTFRAMINECEPKYIFPGRSTFSETVIPKMYQVAASRVRNELLESQAVAWTTDSWTSRATQSYVTITAHYINSDFQLCSRVLQTIDLPESHTGEHVAHVLQEASTEWGCGISALTTDNASNMKVAARVANISVQL